MTTIVDLETWEYNHIAAVAAWRTTANWEVGHIPAYAKNKFRMEDDRTAAFAAAACECAVAKHVNQYWIAGAWSHAEHKTHRNRPDVGKNIEVRRVREKRLAAIRIKEVGQGKILYVAYAIPPEFRQVELLGWGLIDSLWDRCEPAPYSPEDTRIVPEKKLYSPELELLN